MFSSTKIKILFLLAFIFNFNAVLPMGNDNGPSDSHLTIYLPWGKMPEGPSFGIYQPGQTNTPNNPIPLLGLNFNFGDTGTSSGSSPSSIINGLSSGTASSSGNELQGSSSFKSEESTIWAPSSSSPFYSASSSSSFSFDNYIARCLSLDDDSKSKIQWQTITPQQWKAHRESQSKIFLDEAGNSYKFTPPACCNKFVLKDEIPFFEKLDERGWETYVKDMKRAEIIEDDADYFLFVNLIDRFSQQYLGALRKNLPNYDDLVQKVNIQKLKKISFFDKGLREFNTAVSEGVRKVKNIFKKHKESKEQDAYGHSKRAANILEKEQKDAAARLEEERKKLAAAEKKLKEENEKKRIETELAAKKEQARVDKEKHDQKLQEKSIPEESAKLKAKQERLAEEIRKTKEEQKRANRQQKIKAIADVLSGGTSTVVNSFIDKIMSTQREGYSPSLYSDRYSYLMPNIQKNSSFNLPNSSSTSSSSKQRTPGKGKRSFSNHNDNDSSSSTSDDTVQPPTSKKPAIYTSAEPSINTATSSDSSSSSSPSNTATIASENVGMEGLHFTTQESISLELNRIRSDVETLKQNFGNVYQANIAYDVTSSLAKIAKFYQQNGNLKKAELFTKLTSVFCDLAKKTVPYVKAIGTAIDHNSTNFQQQFDQFSYDPIGTTAKMIQHFYNAFVESNKNNDRMWRDEQYRKQQLNLLFNKIKDFANLPGPKKLEKATEFALGLFSGYAFLGPLGLTGVSAAEVSALSEASQTMYSALKTECINAVQLAAKTGLPPESFAGLANVIREFPETLAAGLQFGTDEAQKLFKLALSDQELITSNYLGKSIAERIKTFAQRFTEKRNLIQTGAKDISVEEWFAGERWAAEEYEKIRKMKDDVGKIVKNTGMPEFKIKRIKQHVFYEDQHILDKRIGRLDPYKPIAEAWNRLINGNFVENDLKLLEHEYFESKFESLFKTTNRVAHEKTISTKDKGYLDREWNPDDNKQ